MDTFGFGFECRPEAVHIDNLYVESTCIAENVYWNNICFCFCRSSQPFICNSISAITCLITINSKINL